MPENYDVDVYMIVIDSFKAGGTPGDGGVVGDRLGAIQADIDVCGTMVSLPSLIRRPAERQLYVQYIRHLQITSYMYTFIASWAKQTHLATTWVSIHVQVFACA